MWRVTVMEHERAVRYDRGRLVGVLAPGQHRVLPWRRTKLVRYDVRERVTTVPGQEVLTADGVGLRASVTARWRIADPRLAATATASVVDAVYAVLQLALRDLVAELPAADVAGARAELAARLTESAHGELTAYGVELVSAALRDLAFPGELKKVFSQVAAARQQSLAAVERARGETAALRALANAARVVDGNPALLALRTLQAADRANATVVVAAPTTS